MGQIDDSFVAHVTEMLSPWAGVSPRRMFGSWGIYRGALMFALVADDVLYLKCGSALRALAGETELELFSYEKKVPALKEPLELADRKPPREKKQTVALSYAAAPVEVLEDGDALRAWAEAAWQDALAGRVGAPKGLPNPKPRGSRGRR